MVERQLIKFVCILTIGSPNQAVFDQAMHCCGAWSQASDASDSGVHQEDALRFPQPQILKPTT